MRRALAVMFALVLVVSAVATPLAVQPASADPGGMVTISENQIDSDLPPNTPMGDVEGDLQERGVLTSGHSDTLEIIVTNPGRAKKYTDGAVFGGGPVAIVMRDDMNSEGRRVAIPVETLENVLGYVPKSAYGTHEDGSTWQDPIQVKDGYAIVDVPHFSDNTVTFAGEINITQSKAGDGSQISYQINDLDAASDVTVNMTGETSTEWDNVSASGVGDGGTISVNPAGNVDPAGPSSNGEPEIQFTGKEGDGDIDVAFQDNYAESNLKYIDPNDNVVDTGANVNNVGGVADVDGDGDLDIVYTEKSSGYLVAIDDSGNKLNFSVESQFAGGIGDIDGDGDLDVAFSDPNDNLKYVDANGNVQDTGETSNRAAAVGDFDGDGDTDIVYDNTASNGNIRWVDSAGNVGGTGVDARPGMGMVDYDGDGDMDVAAYDSSVDNIGVVDKNGNTDWWETSLQNYGASEPVDFDGDGDYDILFRDGNNDLRYTDKNANVGSTSAIASNSMGAAGDFGSTDSPGADIDGDGTDEANHTGTLSPGETATYEISSLSVSDDTTTISTKSGKVDVSIELKEKTVTQDPSVELNGTAVSHSGTLSDGDTVSKTINKSELQEGENVVNISVGDGSLSADAPAPTVGLEYVHETQDDQTVTYDAEKWSERYNVSKTYASDRAQADLTIPHQGSVIEMRSIEYRINESGGWTSMSSAYYSLDGTELTVDVDEIAGGSVEANETVEVRTTASKVAVNAGEITVLEPTTTGSTLDSKVQINSWSDSSYIDVGGTPDGQRIHYTYNESYSGADEYAIVTSSGDNQINLPNAGVGSEFRISTVPVTASPTTGDVEIAVDDPKSTEPQFQVSPGDASGDEVEFTYVDAKDDTDYILYSKTNDIVRDSGTANSPITLTDDDSDETLQFLIDDSNTTSSGGGGGGSVVMPPSSGGIDFGGIGILVAVLAGGLGLLVLLRRRGSGAASRAASGVLGGLQGTTSWLASNPRITALLGGIGFVASVMLGFIQLPPGTGILLLVTGVPLGAFLLLRRLGQFSMTAFGTISIITVVVGLELLGADPLNILLSNLGPALPIIAFGLLYILYQRVQASQSPDEVNQVEIKADGGDDEDDNQ